MIDIKFNKEGNTLVVMIEGEIDHHTAMMARERIDSKFLMEPVKNMALDLSRVNFMDSAGIGLILGRKSRVSGVGGTLTIRKPKPAIRKLLKLSKMESMVE
ncbi:MAG: anti-sigma factor antagonist [Clostridiaceae bacterium]|nr:anti-sigma factor antagonist [Clostridiaceae bacterium]